jgi:hypothetical protein
MISRRQSHKEDGGLRLNLKASILKKKKKKIPYSEIQAQDMLMCSALVHFDTVTMGHHPNISIVQFYFVQLFCPCRRHFLKELKQNTCHILKA